MKAFSFFLAITIAFLSLSCSTKLPRAQVSFHTQTSKGENKNMVFPYKMGERVISLRRMPDFVLSNIETYRPFPAKDGKTYGAMFLLDNIAAKRLIHFSTERQGYYMVSIINGKVSEPLVIDKPINDGVLIIWKGLTVKDIRSLDIEIPRTGEDEEKWKVRSKEAKKALKNVIEAEKIKKKS